jgi:HK97 family phage portal protein
LKTVSLNELPEEAWNVVMGRPYTDDDSEDLQTLYKKVPWLFAGVDIRANALMAMPFSIYQGEDDNQTVVDSNDQYTNALGFLPNPTVLFGLIEMALTIWGYSYLYRRPNLTGSRPYKLQYLISSKVEHDIKADQTGEPIIRFRRRGKDTWYDDDKFVYFWKPDPFVELGPPTASPAEAASAAAGVVLNVDKFAAAFFKRGAIKPTLLVTKGRVVKGEREKLKSWWDRMFTGIKRAWQTEIVNGDAVEAVQVGEGLEALKNQEISEEKREAIATALRIPHTMLFSNAANYATADVDRMWLYENCINAEARFIEAVINEQLLKPMGYRLAFEPERMDIFQQSEAERADALTQLVTTLSAGPIAGVAMDILGYDVDEEQRQKLEQIWAANLSNDTREDAGEIEDDDDVVAGEGTGLTPDAKSELGTWQRWASKHISGGLDRDFECKFVPPVLAAAISGALETAKTEDDVKAIFTDVWAGYP